LLNVLISISDILKPLQRQSVNCYPQIYRERLHA
jgi:hypothetical protein